MARTPVLGALIAAVLSSASALLAHSSIQATNRADGAVLEAAREILAMTFVHPMRVTLVRLTVSDGAEIEVARTDGMALVTQFKATTAELGTGAYTMDRRRISGDGHPMHGSFSFRVAG